MAFGELYRLSKVVSFVQTQNAVVGTTFTVLEILERNLAWFLVILVGARDGREALYVSSRERWIMRHNGCTRNDTLNNTFVCLRGEWPHSFAICTGMTEENHLSRPVSPASHSVS